MPKMKTIDPGQESINWNVVPEFEKMVWDKLVQQFWVDTKLPLSNDIPSWRKMTPEEQEVLKEVFVSLTALDTLQSEMGADVLKLASSTQFEAAIFSQIAFIESIHAKFYSSVFSTLLTSEEINDLFAWSDSNPNLTYKRDKIRDFYVRAAAVVGDDDESVAAANAVAAKIASVVLESFLFYSGFYAPLYFSAHSKLTNTSDGIKLILRDEAIHGSYIGARFQANMEEWGFTPEQVEEVHTLFIDLVNDLYANEVEWTHKVYDKIGKSEDVIRFLRYNANRVAENLGYDPVFVDDITPSAEIIAALNIDSTNFDFFSGNGDSYAVIETETMTDDEWGDIF